MPGLILTHYPLQPRHKDRREVHRYGAVARFLELFIQTLYLSKLKGSIL